MEQIPPTHQPSTDDTHPHFIPVQVHEKVTHHIPKWFILFLILVALAALFGGGFSLFKTAQKYGKSTPYNATKQLSLMPISPTVTPTLAPYPETFIKFTKTFTD